jgi:hypothetical protein
MVAIVSVETVLLVVLLVLVAGLLRSNAEILRRLGPPGEETAPAPSAPATPAAPARVPGTPAPPLAGPTPSGDAIMLDFGASGSRPTLLAFLTTGCATCAGFWESLAERPVAPGVQTVVVAHNPERERLQRLRELAPDGVPVVMSSQAWQDYEVSGSPYFVLVDGSIRGEGVATTWESLSSLVGDAVDDVQARSDGNGHNGGGTARALGVDRTLARAGIGPEHPSLHPAPPRDGE